VVKFSIDLPGVTRVPLDEDLDLLARKPGPIMARRR